MTKRSEVESRRERNNTQVTDGCDDTSDSGNEGSKETMHKLGKDANEISNQSAVEDE